MIDELQDILIEAARHMFGVSDVAGAFAVEFDAIADGGVGVVETGGLHDDAVIGGENIPWLEIPVVDIGDEDFGDDREIGRLHDAGDHVVRRHHAGEMA